MHFSAETGIITLRQKMSAAGVLLHLRTRAGSGRKKNKPGGLRHTGREPLLLQRNYERKNQAMERTEIVSQILAILEDVAEISPDDVNENSVLMDDLDLSSMEILTVVADLEETFGLRIPEKELRNFVTVSDLADYLAAHAGE